MACAQGRRSGRRRQPEQRQHACVQRRERSARVRRQHPVEVALPAQGAVDQFGGEGGVARARGAGARGRPRARGRRRRRRAPPARARGSATARAGDGSGSPLAEGSARREAGAAKILLPGHGAPTLGLDLERQKRSGAESRWQCKRPARRVSPAPRHVPQGRRWLSRSGAVRRSACAYGLQAKDCTRARGSRARRPGVSSRGGRRSFLRRGASVASVSACGTGARRSSRARTSMSARPPRVGEPTGQVGGRLVWSDGRARGQRAQARCPCPRPSA